MNDSPFRVFMCESTTDERSTSICYVLNNCLGAFLMCDCACICVYINFCMCDRLYLFHVCVCLNMSV